MASELKTSPTTYANDASYGATAWNVIFRTCPVDKTTSYYLKCTGFGFGIPSGATINGVHIAITASASAGTSAAQVQLVKGGSVAGTAKSGASFPAGPYGGASDLWGTTWSATEINASGFGVALSGTGSANGCDLTFSDVAITVYYTTSAGVSKMMFHPF